MRTIEYASTLTDRAGDTGSRKETMATDTLSLILLPLCGLVLLAGLGTAVWTFVRIIRTRPQQ